jgi:hypothetical protein
MTQQESPKGRSGQRPIPDCDGYEAAVAAHLAELDEAKQDGNDELWNDICSDGIEVEIGGVTWELWFGQDGWTAARPSYEPEFPESRRGRRRRPDGPGGSGRHCHPRRSSGGWSRSSSRASRRINRPKVEPRPGMLGRYAQLAGCRGVLAWTDSWTGSPDNPSAASAVNAITRAIGAASACAAGSHASRNAPLVGFRRRLRFVVATYWHAETLPVLAGL